MVDFEKKAVYGGIGFDLGKCQEEHRLVDLSGKDAAFIRETAAATGMTGWDNLHILNGKDTMDGNVDWTIGIRLDSGECIKYEETGYVEYDAPEDAGVAFCWTLWTHFTETGSKEKSLLIGQRREAYAIKKALPVLQSAC